MTVAMTQGVLNALNPKTLDAWQARRARRSPGRPPQSKAQFRRAVSQLQAAFPRNVKVN